MANATCSVDDCEREVYARSICRRHYDNARRAGTLEVQARRVGCAVDGCDREHWGKGYCRLHLGRFLRYGDPLDPGRIIGDDERRFWSYVDQDGPGGCWLWTGARTTAGYGTFSVDSGSVYAHRWSYEHHVGPIPEGLTIDHVHARGCRHTHCVNPEHLEAVTQAENNRRAWEAGVR